MMILLNGMVGLSLLVGAWRHPSSSTICRGERVSGPDYSAGGFEPGPPRFHPDHAGATLSAHQPIFLIIMSAGLYCAFLLISDGTASRFLHPRRRTDRTFRQSARAALSAAVLLLAYMAPVVSLAEKLAIRSTSGRDLALPDQLGGLLIALSLRPPRRSRGEAALPINCKDR